MDVASVTGTTTTTSSTLGAGLDGLSGQDFMEILIAQLQYQDPMEPMGNEEMVSQIASIRDLEMNSRLTDSLSQLTEQQRTGSAAALIGKYVKGSVEDAEGNAFTMEGVVMGIKFTESGEAMLELDSGESLPLAKLSEVTNAEVAA